MKSSVPLVLIVALMFAQASESYAQAESEQAKAVVPAGTELRAKLAKKCPMAIKDVGVSLSGTTSGVVLSFRATQTSMEALRQRVRYMSDMYAEHDALRGIVWYQINGRRIADVAGVLPAVNVAVVYVESGAEVVLTPADPGQLETLRIHILGHHERLRIGGCWTLAPLVSTSFR